MTDPLEALREVSRMMAARPDDIIEEPRGWVHCREEMQPMLDAAIAAWEKERAMFTGRVPYVDRTLLLQNAHKLQALRAEVLAVAAMIQGNVGDPPHADSNDAYLADLAARLRKACE